MSSFNSNIIVEPDGLCTPEVREWSLEKYRLVGSYCDIFTTGMKGKWDQLIYIDLFAGAGYSRIKETQKTYLSSSLIAMSIPNKFTKYILCEEDPVKFSSLKLRVERDFAHLNFEIIKGDCNVLIDKIFNSIPKFSKGNTLLSFCFIDPYSFNFSTIEKLGGSRNMDFLILQALHMDGNRNLNKYLDDENERISNYLGNPNWRNEFKSNNKYSTNFVKFLSNQYQVKMGGIGYKTEKQMHPIRSNEKNLPLYYLVFYSKHQKGIDFFKNVEKYVSPQLKFDF